MKHTLLVLIILVMFIIPGVLAFQHDFQNGTVGIASGGTASLFSGLDGLDSNPPAAETLKGKMKFASLGNGYAVIWNPDPISATNWSVTVEDLSSAPPGVHDQAIFRFYKDAVLLTSFTDDNKTHSYGVISRYDLTLEADGTLVTYVDGIRRQRVTLANTPNYFNAGYWIGPSTTYFALDDYIISPSPSSDATTRNIIESFPSDYYIVLDSLNPGNNGVYNATGVSNGFYYWNTISTISNASKREDVVNVGTNTIYDSLWISRCVNQTRWNISSLVTASAPTGLYRFQWVESGYGTHYSNPFWITTNGASVLWDRAEYITGEQATTSWNIVGGYWSVADYEYSGKIINSLGTVIKTWTISAQAGSENTILDSTSYPDGTYWFEVIATEKAAPFNSYILNVDNADIYTDLSISGITYDASASVLLPLTGVNITQTGIATQKTSTSVSAQYNISGLVPSSVINLTATKFPKVHAPVLFTPLSYGNYTINLYLTDDPNNQTHLAGGDAIYGIVFATPYYDAVPGATVRAWNGTAYTTTTTNASGFYIIDPVAAYETYNLNATATGYANSPTYTKSSPQSYTGTVYNATRQDLLLSRVYEIEIMLKNYDTGAFIFTGSVDVSDGVDVWTDTAPLGHVNFTLGYGLYSIGVSASGYTSASTTRLFDSDEVLTIYLTPAPSTADQTIWNSPHQVRWQVVDRYGNRLPNVEVNITPIGMTLPNNSNWLLTMFGLGSTVTPMINATSMNGTTGTDGAIVFTMLGSIQYNVLFTNAALGINHLETINPIEDQYTVWVPTTATAIARNCGLTANASLFVNASPSGAINLNVSYTDSSLSTTNFTFWLSYPNGTIIHSTDFFYTPAGPNSTVNANWTVQNTRGDSWIFGYYANTTSCGNLTAAQGLVLKGPQNRLIQFDGCEVTAAGCGWD